MFRTPCVCVVFTLVSAVCFAQSPSEPAAPHATDPTQSAAPAKAGDAVALSATANANAPATAAPNPLEEGLSLYRRGKYDAAIAQYQEYLQRFPKSADAYAGLVRIALKQNKVEQAAETIEKGLALNDAPRMHVARGEVWFRQGKISEAENEWTGVINRGFPDARAYLGLARVRNAVAMYKDADRLIGKAHELDPTDPEIYERWIGTLPREERIKYLEDSLGGENNWSADERAAAARYLELLKEPAKQKSSCHLVSKFDATETPLVRLQSDPSHLRGFGLSVALNGHKSELMLDTGAGGIVVTRSVAEHAGISKITATKIGGIGDKGMRNAYVGVADSIKIGKLEFQNCPVEIMESRRVGGEEGLIGADVFQDFLVDIDFPSEKLRLSQLPRRPGEPEQKLSLKSEEGNEDDSAAPEPGDDSKSSVGAKDTSTKTAPPAPASSGRQDRYVAPEMQSYSRVFRFGHDLLIPTTIGKAPPKLFLIDTGSLMNFISPAAAREVTKVHGDSDTIVEGLSGRVANVYSANKAVLQFGRLRQENQEMTSFDTTTLSDGLGVEVSGFLGFILLRFLDIKIDYRDALVDFSYDPKHFNQ
jgi:tetratricopeptide (TPR) repeat protein